MTAAYKGPEAAAQLVAARYPDYLPAELGPKDWGKCIRELLPRAIEIRRIQEAEQLARQEW